MNGKGKGKVRDVSARTAQKILAQEKQVKEMGWKIMRNGLDALRVYSKSMLMEEMKVTISAEVMTSPCIM